MREIMNWLGRWERPMEPAEMATLVPADNARGYQWYPQAVPMAVPKEKADFSRAPQLRWWMEEEKTIPQARGKRSRD